MSSSGFKKKKFKVDPGPRPNSDINVTPLVDVVLVLLIIFMVVTPLMEKDIQVQVPQTEEVDTTNDVPPDQLVVNVDAKGEISINNKPVTAEAFEEEMKKILNGHKQGDKIAFFQADDDANYGTLVSVMDKTKLAGAEVLGMMTQLPEGVQTVNPGAAPGGAPAAPTPPPAPGTP